MIPKIIHYCWFGNKELQDESKTYIHEWKELNPEWEIIFWNEENLPFDELYITTAFKERNWANMSNFLRLYALKEYGGIYLDTDIKLIKPLDTFCNDKCFFGFEEGEEASDIFWVNNAICGSEKKHPFITQCYDTLLKQYDGTEMANLSGPKLTTELLKTSRGLHKYGYQKLKDIVIYPKEFFYPIHYSEIYKLANFKEYIYPETVAIHVWARTWLTRDSLLYIIDDLYRLNYQYLQQINEQTSLIEALKSEKNISLSGIPASHLAQQKLLVKLQRISDGQYFSKTLMEEFSQSIQKLNLDLNNKSEQLESLQDQYQKTLLHKNHLSASLDETNNIIITLKGELEQQKSVNSLVKNDYDNAIKTINNQQLILSDFLQTIQENKERIQLLSTQIKQTEEKATALEKAYQDNQDLFHQLKAQNSDDAARLLELISIKDAQQTENEKLTQTILSLQEENSKKEKEIGLITKKLQDVIASESFFKERVNSQKTENDKLKKDISDLSNHQNMLKTSHEKNIKRLENDIKSLQDSISWYRDTYENRRLAGILKDRLKKNLKVGLRTSKAEKASKLVNNNAVLLKKNNPENTTAFIEVITDKAIQLNEIAGQANRILCAIVNHNHNENAKKLRALFSTTFETVVFDSGSKIKEPDFINLPNIYYSGLYNQAYNWAIDKGFDYLLFMCSDVEIEEEEANKMIRNLSTMNLDHIGVYSPASHGRSHYQCKKKNQQGLRVVDFVEGFMFLANIKLLKEFSPLSPDKNILGWGIDVVKGYYARKLNLLCVIDDEVTIYHPEETGYSSDEAENQMYEWFYSLPEGDRIKQFHTDRVERIRKGIEEKMKISVLVPCYNQSQYLNEAVLSIFNQTYSDFEIIIINDGSTDNTDVVAKRLAEQYNQVKYIRQKNMGLGAARNTGLLNSTGDFIQFLDADDLLDKEKFNNAINIFSKEHNIDIVYSAYTCFEDGNPEKTWTYSRVELNGDPVADLINEWEKDLSIPVHCFLFKKDTIGNILFDVSLPNHEDWAFHLNIAAKNPVYRHDEKSTAYYRIKQIAMSQNKIAMTNGKNMCIANAINSKKFHSEYVKKLFLRFDYSLVVGIITCAKNKDKMDEIRSTWAKDLETYGIKHFFILGDASAKETYVKDDIIYVNCFDNYESLPKKVFLFYEYIAKNMSFDYVFKIDDDCYVNIENLFATYFWNYDYFGKIVATHEEDLNRSWHFGKCESVSLNSIAYSVPYYGEWCGGGFGYFLSRNAITALQTKKDQICNDLYEDKAIGDALRQSGILPVENINYRVLDIQQFKIDHNSQEAIQELLDHIGEDIFKYQTIIELKNNFYYTNIKQIKQQHVTY